MSVIIYNCPALTVTHDEQDENGVMIYGDEGMRMSLLEIRDMGQAIVKYFQHHKGKDVFSN